jgi:hypothetical protein
MTKTNGSTNPQPEPNKQTSWGIIRYAPGSGQVPEDDAAAFDGWYAKREDAMSVAEHWVKQHPQWIVAVVGYDTAWFGDGDFHSVADRPLTRREYVLSRKAFQKGATS